jgi:hypothetical protein
MSPRGQRTIAFVGVCIAMGLALQEGGMPDQGVVLLAQRGSLARSVSE